MKTKFSEKKASLPQRKRVPEADLPRFRITKRERQIVRAVYDYRALTTNQISGLLFAPPGNTNGSPPSSRCLHRLKLLFQHQFLARLDQPHLLSEGRRPFLYRVDRRGLELIALEEECEVDQLEWHVDEELSPLFLEHLIAENDVRIAIVRAANRHGFTIERWLDERALKQAQNTDVVVLTGASGKKQRAAVVPDGYFHLHTDEHHYHQFLEIDRSTVTGISTTWHRRTWARKVATYVEYYNSGKYHERYHTKSMRILTVTTGGEKRLANLKEITEASGGKSRFWFATLQDVLSQDVLVTPIWHVAGQEGLRSLVW